jgi:cobyrinic acid a,c-diamide synthase
MRAACPTLVIAGTNSGVGKTSLAVGLTRALARRGLRVQTFKVGPDFLDPTYLTTASGRTCYNLDGWMTSREYVRGLFARTTADADVALVEGVMGMFDGASATTLEGSTAEMALWLDAPVLLVVDAHGTARSLAATVKGFAAFEPAVRLAGVIANRGGSHRHRAWLIESLHAATTPPLVGMIPNGALPSLPSRHLGLVTADQTNLADILDQLADACDQHLDLSAIVDLTKQGAKPPTHQISKSPNPQIPKSPNPSIRLAIARDEAFHFYYPDNLEAFAAAGAELVNFSPIADARLPADLDGIYFGGGYPEVHAARLAANVSMLADVRQFAASGGAIYAECGGLMYLGQSLTALDGVRHAMAGVLPIETAMLDRLKSLGYVEVTLQQDSLWGPAGTVFRGHEFHYSEIKKPLSADAGWQTVYSVQHRSGEPAKPEGFQRENGRILASYVHGHFASHPRLIEAFLKAMGTEEVVVGTACHSQPSLRQPPPSPSVPLTNGGRP